MSYLQIPNGIPGFTKAVISFWFRVPQTSIDKNVAQAPPFLFPDDPRNVLLNVIPLVTIGKPPTSPRFEGESQDVAHDGNPAFPYPDPIYDTVNINKVASDPISPSYIGLNCFSKPADDSEIIKTAASLSFNLQLTGRAIVTGMAYNRKSATVWSVSDAGGPFGTMAEVFTTPGSGYENLGEEWGTFTDVVDNSEFWETQPEHYLVQSTVAIEPDGWHHLLLSFDISTPCTTHGAEPDLSHMGASSSNETTAAGTDKYCRLWYAIDDVNYNRSTFDLGPYEVSGSPDMNAILTANAHAVADTTTVLPYNCTPARPSYTFAPVLLPSAEIGIPAAASCVNNIYHVEMAEFQLFTDIALDTSVESNRRAFIDYERDERGIPIKDKDGNLTLLPVQPVGLPAPAEKLLKKKPEILLHGSSNWINGENTGTTGINYGTDPPAIIPEGQFQPFGRIKPYRPDPSLPTKPPASSTRRNSGPVRLTKKPAANARL